MTFLIILYSASFSRAKCHFAIYCFRKLKCLFINQFFLTVHQSLGRGNIKILMRKVSFILYYRINYIEWKIVLQRSQELLLFHCIHRTWVLKDAKFILVHDGDVHFTKNPYTTETWYSVITVLEVQIVAYTRKAKNKKLKRKIHIPLIM